MVYKSYILPTGGLYITYHLLREPESAIEETVKQIDVGLLSSSFGNDEVVFQPSIFRVYVSFREGMYTYLPRHEHDFLLLEPPFFSNEAGPRTTPTPRPQKQEVKIANGAPVLSYGLPYIFHGLGSGISGFLAILALPPETPDLHPDH